MRVNRKELLVALTAVQPGLAAKENIEQSNTFVFNDGKVFTFNGEIAVSHPIEIDLEGSIPAKEFHALLGKSTAEEIEMEIKKDNDGEELFVKVGRAKTGFRLQSEILLPIESIGEPSKWNKLPEKFCEAVKFSLYTVSRNPELPILQCIHIYGNSIESSDMYRITRYNMGKGAKIADELLIPVVSAKEIYSYKPDEYAVTQGWVHFRNKAGVTFSCRFLEEEFPEVDHLLKCKGGHALTLPGNIDAILDRANVMTSGDRVNVILESGSITVCAENSSGWFEEDARTEFEGDPMEFDIQPEFLKFILKQDAEAMVNESILKFTTEHFEHSICLLSPKKKK